MQDDDHTRIPHDDCAWLGVGRFDGDDGERAVEDAELVRYPLGHPDLRAGCGADADLVGGFGIGRPVRLVDQSAGDAAFEQGKIGCPVRRIAPVIPHPGDMPRNSVVTTELSCVNNSRCSLKECNRWILTPVPVVMIRASGSAADGPCRPGSLS